MENTNPQPQETTGRYTEVQLAQINDYARRGREVVKTLFTDETGIIMSGDEAAEVVAERSDR